MFNTQKSKYVIYDLWRLLVHTTLHNRLWHRAPRRTGQGRARGRDSTASRRPRWVIEWVHSTQQRAGAEVQDSHYSKLYKSQSQNSLFMPGNTQPTHSPQFQISPYFRAHSSYNSTCACVDLFYSEDAEGWVDDKLLSRALCGSCSSTSRANWTSPCSSGGALSSNTVCPCANPHSRQQPRVAAEQKPNFYFI